MQLPSVPRKPCGHHDRFVMAAQAAPLSRGLALGVTVFAYPENFVTKRKIQNTTTSAKTRATAMQRQQHLPPNVSSNCVTVALFSYNLFEIITIKTHKMKKVLILSVVLYTMVLTTSCQKEDLLTDRDKIEAELLEFTKSNNITLCTIYEFRGSSWVQRFQNSEFSLSNGFITVNQGHPITGTKYTFNLAFLYSFRIIDNVLILEFIIS